MVQQPQRGPNVPGPLAGGGAFANLDFPGLSDTKVCSHAQAPVSEKDFRETPYAVAAAPQPDSDAPLDAVSQGMGPPPGFSFPNLQVKNTFLQVDESGDGVPSHQIPFRRRGHLRCASEPLWGASEPRWELRPPSDAHEPMSLKPCFSEVEDGNSSFHDNSAAPFNFSSNSHLSLPVGIGGIGEGASEDGSSCKGSVGTSASSLQPGFLRARHSRQCSTQTVCTIDEAIGSNGSDDTFENHEKDKEAVLVGGVPCSGPLAPEHQHPGGQFVDGPTSCSAGPRGADADPASRQPETISLHLMNLSPRIREQAADDEAISRDESGGSIGTAIGERPARRHLRQWSIQTAATIDEFENNVPSGDVQEQSIGADASGCHSYQNLLGCMPDPRLSDPWAARNAAVAAAASKKFLASAVNDAAVGLHGAGSSASAPGRDQGGASLLPPRGAGGSPDMWQHCDNELPKFTAQTPFATPLQLHAELNSRMPATVLPPGPVGPLSSFTHPGVSAGSLHASAALPNVGGNVLSSCPGWSLHRPPFPVPTMVTPERKPLQSEADSTAAAYAQGVAAGADLAAWAKGFAAGIAASTAAAGHRTSIDAMSAPAYAAPAPQELKMHMPNRSDKASCKKPAQEAPFCKWFAKGSCKFGEGCRYRHQLVSSESVAADLAPRGTNALLPSGSTYPVVPSLHSKSEVQQKEPAAYLGSVTLSTHGQQLGPEASSSLSLSSADALEVDPALKSEFQIFWCDQRAFKDTATPLKTELETETGVPVKTYRTADMCMRLLRKKRHWQGKDVARLFLVSWANAQVLVPYLNESQHIAARVVVLCDTCGTRGCNKAEAWAQQFSFVTTVANTWPQAVAALRQSVHAHRQT